MRRTLWLIAVLAVVAVGLVPCSVGADLTPDALWVMANDDAAEVRLGWDVSEDSEIALAPRYCDPFADGGQSIALRCYGLYNIVDANMVGEVLHSPYSLPPGALYIGLWGGLVLDKEVFNGGEDHDVEAGFLVGGMIGVLRIEYQYAFDKDTWSSFGTIPDQQTLIAGFKWRFK